MKRRWLLGVAGLGLVAHGAWAEESDADRAARWKGVAQAIFGSRPVQDGSDWVQIDAPPRALDAALVPVTITLSGPDRPAALYLVIDDNPAPLAGVFHFGSAADPHVLKTRVRVDQYTLIHAVAETADGRLYGVGRFIKAAGGCSAPGAGNLVEAMARIGRMKLTVTGATAQLLISHPNLNGMQMDPVSRLYTPARYVERIRVTQGGAPVLLVDGNISLSEDPSVTFGFMPRGNEPFDVEVTDSSKAVFRRSFALLRRQEPISTGSGLKY